MISKSIIDTGGNTILPSQFIDTVSGTLNISDFINDKPRISFTKDRGPETPVIKTPSNVKGLYRYITEGWVYENIFTLEQSVVVLHFSRRQTHPGH